MKDCTTERSAITQKAAKSEGRAEGSKGELISGKKKGGCGRSCGGDQHGRKMMGGTNGKDRRARAARRSKGREGEVRSGRDGPRWKKVDTR